MDYPDTVIASEVASIKKQARQYAEPEVSLWWPYQDSNLEPVDYESIALTVAP